MPYRLDSHRFTRKVGEKGDGVQAVGHCKGLSLCRAHTLPDELEVAQLGHTFNGENLPKY